MAGWRLGVDFGTTYTVAAIASAGSVSVLDVEYNGNSRLPSSVYLTEDGETLVGTAAMHQAVFVPERYEPTPKRAIGEGEIFLGDRMIAVSELVAAVFRRVYSEACRQHGETMPDAVNVTHPADWTATRLDVLREALSKAGITTATLLPEPVAAAARIAATTPVGEHIAVYDFGGGTFDAAVLRRTAGGFAVAGPPAGRDPLGGEDIDRRIIAHLGTVVGEDNEPWLAMLNPATSETRRQAAELRSEVQRAKETLSEVSACQLWVPGVGRGVQLTRSELEKLITPDVEATVDTLERALTDAGIVATDLAGLYLVGGSSRIPLVADTIWRRLKVRPAVQENPKSVVALGAAAWDDSRSGDQPTVPLPAPLPGPTGTQPLPIRGGGTVGFRGLLAADVSRGPWAAGSSAVFQLTVDRPGPDAGTLRARDEPTALTRSIDLASQAGEFRAARTPGYRDLGTEPATVFGEHGGARRRFAMTSGASDVTMIEQYLVVAGRALVAACPESMLDLVDAMTLAPAAPPESFTLRFEFATKPGWSLSEQVVVRRETTAFSFIAERSTAPAGTTSDSWLTNRLAQVMPQLGSASVAARSSAAVLSGLPGEIATVRWRSRRGAPMLTKLGVAVADRDVYTVTISLPHQDQSQFSSLARQVRISGLTS